MLARIQMNSFEINSYKLSFNMIDGEESETEKKRKKKREKSLSG